MERLRVWKKNMMSAERLKDIGELSLEMRRRSRDLMTAFKKGCYKEDGDRLIQVPREQLQLQGGREVEVRD